MRLIKEKLNRHKHQLLILGLILILGLTPLLWFKSGCLIGGVDFDFPLDPIRRFIERKYTWSSMFLGGVDRSMDIPGGFSFIGTQALLRALGLSLFSLQKITFIFWYTMTGLSMYFFMSLLVGGEDKKSRVICLASTIFYMFNFYQLHIWMIARIGELSGAIIIPAALGLLIVGLERKMSFAKMAGFASIFFLVGSGIGVQPPVLGVFLFVLIAYFIFHLLSSNHWRGGTNLVRDIHPFILLILIFVFINMFWILPVANYIIQSGYTDSAKVQDVFALKSLLEITSRHNSFLNVIRVYGDANWFDGFKDEPYMPFFPTYQTNILLIILSFMLPILAYSAILFSRHRYVIFFAVIIIITTFFGKGIHPPLGNVFLWMFKNIPGFWIYRAPWQKFGLLMILGYSFLAGITCGKIYEYLQNRISLHRIATKSIGFLKLWKAIPASCIIGIIVLNIGYNYAFVFGKMLPTTEERKTLPGYHQKYPQYLFDSADWINSQKEDFKMVLLPDDRANAYEWGYGGAGDITLKLFTQGLIFRQYKEGMAPPHPLARMYQIFISSLYNGVTPNATNILRLLNVRYLLHRNDFLYDWSGDSDSPQFIRTKLGLQNDIHLEKSFGKWDFYRVDDCLPRICATSNATMIDCNIDSLISLSHTKYLDNRPCLLFIDQLPPQVKENLMDKVDTLITFKKGEIKTRRLVKKFDRKVGSPKISYRKINPTRYKIHVDAEEPFWLVFNESFHQQWRAYLNQKSEIRNQKSDEFKEIIAEYPNLAVKEARHLQKFTPRDIEYLFRKEDIKDHCLVNGYANAWYIDTEELRLGKDFIVTLYFWPQSLFYLGLFVSGVTFVGCIGYSAVSLVKRRIKNAAEID